MYDYFPDNLNIFDIGGGEHSPTKSKKKTSDIDITSKPKNISNISDTNTRSNNINRYTTNISSKRHQSYHNFLNHIKKEQDDQIFEMDFFEKTKLRNSHNKKLAFIDTIILLIDLVIVTVLYLSVRIII